MWEMRTVGDRAKPRSRGLDVVAVPSFQLVVSFKEARQKLIEVSVHRDFVM